MIPLTSENMQVRLRLYAKRLENLTGRNRLLRILRTIKRAVLDFHDLDQVLDHQSFELLTQAVIDRKEVKLSTYINPRDSSANVLSAALRKLYDQDQLLQEEKGVQDLHIGWPIVIGRFNDKHFVRCPLLLFPVKLWNDGKHWMLKTRGVGEYNMTFLLAYFRRNNLPWDENADDFVVGEPKDMRDLLSTLYKQVEDSELRLRFSTQHFEGRLKEFLSMSSEDVKMYGEAGQLDVVPQAVLALFEQPSTALLRDYRELLAIDSPVPTAADFFQSAPPLPDSAKEASESSIITPLRRDASQEQALLRIKQGDSLVVQGPPGTGKSQLIANVVCDFLARGKRVLLACQKKAALEVVHARLSTLGIEPFIAQVHDVRYDRKALYEQLNKQIDRVTRSTTDLFQDINLEHRFDEKSRRLDVLVADFEKLRSALLDTTICGISVCALYKQADATAPVVDVQAYYHRLPYDKQEDFMRELRAYLTYAVMFDAQHPWYNRRSFARYGVADLVHLNPVTVAEFLQFKSLQTDLFFHQTPGRSIALNKVQQALGQLDALKNFVATIPRQAPKAFTLTWLPACLDKTLRWADADWKKALAGLAEQQRVLEQLPTLLLNIEKKEALFVLEALDKLKRLPKALRMFWLFFYNRKQVYQLLDQCNYSHNWEGLEQLEVQLRATLRFVVVQRALKQTRWVVGDCLPTRGATVTDWITALKQLQALGCSAQAFTKTCWKGWDLQWQAGLGACLKQWLLRLEGVKETLKGLTKYFTPQQLNQLVADPRQAEVWKKALDDFDELCAFDKLREAFSPWKVELLEHLHDKLGTWEVETVARVYQNSWAQAWISHIEQLHDVLREPSQRMFANKEAELVDLFEEKERLSQELLTMRLQKQACEMYEKNPTGNRLRAYVKLSRQLIKKRKAPSIRKLLDGFADEVFSLAPCWLTRPEAAAALFPLEKMFDIVLFDEASQCYAEEGLPVLYRGKQVAVIGDKHQLQPNSLYKSQWEEAEDQSDAEETEEVEVLDSLLELATGEVDDVMLVHHYRSASPHLISFSNKRFYDYRLQLLPAYVHEQEQRTSVYYHKVAGTWEPHKRINAQEAEAVVEQVQQLVQQYPEDTLGVITFNSQQQAHLGVLLEDAGREWESTTARQSIFVKNIENVQGDERDHIVLSVGYGHDAAGTFSRKFGSLNQVGGENRLNVAVTRAKKSMHILASFYPEQLHVEGLKNKGPVYLQEYLEMAYAIAHKGFEFSPSPSHKKEIEALVEVLGDHLPTDWSVQVPAYADGMLVASGIPQALLFMDTLAYARAFSAKAYHLYRLLQLKHQGWRYCDFYSRNQWRSSDGYIKNLEKLLVK